MATATATASKTAGIKEIVFEWEGKDKNGKEYPALTARIAGTGLSVTAFQMFFFAAFALLVAALFALYAMRYKMVDNYRKETIN